MIAISFEGNPGWSVGLDGFVGLSTLFGTDTRGAVALGGGLLRARYRFYEAGGYYEVSDSLGSGGQWQSVGGFLGAWLPYKNWVDFEIAARIGARQFADSDPRFGPSGYEVWGSALGLVLGVSDRATTGGLFGGRVGATLVGTYDLKQRDMPWTWSAYDEETGTTDMTSGQTHVGGFSVAMNVTLGFDVGEGG